MTEEYDAILQNRTWTLVPRPVGANIVSGKWIFKHKFGADGALARYKARWVVRGFSQQPGIDYDETFSPVVKPATALCSASPSHMLGRFISWTSRMPSSMAISTRWSTVSSHLASSTLHVLTMSACSTSHSMDSSRHPARGTSVSWPSSSGWVSAPPAPMRHCSSTIGALLLHISYSM